MERGKENAKVMSGEIEERKRSRNRGGDRKREKGKTEEGEEGKEGRGVK